MDTIISSTMNWKDILGGEKSKPYFRAILQFIEQEESRGKTIYPPKEDRFNAFKATPYDNVKVVLLGQDPYHAPSQAHGLSFSVKRGIQPPPSLVNIFQELHASLGLKKPNHGCLQKWAAEGVLLLNTSLTVERGKPQSHAKIGWTTFTDFVISALNNHPHALVFLLWGAHAQSKLSLIDKKRHKVLVAPHPSPLSAHRGFLGCRHFSQCNTFLISKGLKPIDWSLSDGCDA